MKSFKKLLCLVVLTISWGNVSPANIPWTGSPNPIPADGNIYYINTAVTLTQDLTIRGTLRLDSTGTVTAGFNIFNKDGGFLHINGGTWWQTSGSFYNGQASIGTINLTSGSFNWNSGTGFINGSNSSGQGLVTISGGTWTHSGLTFTNGSLGGSGTFNLTGGAFNLTGDYGFSNGSGSQGTVNIFDGTLTQSASFYNGYASNSIGTINLIGGNWISSGNVYNGFSSGSQGTLTISGGTWTHNWGSFYNGDYGVGIFNLTSGAFNWNASSFNSFYNGNHVGSQGTLTISGGTWNQAAGYFYNGYSGIGTINFTNGIFNWNAGGGFYNGYDSGAQGTLTISGGTWNQTAGYFSNSNYVGSQGILTVSSGTWTFSGVEASNGGAGTGIINLVAGAVNLNPSNHFYNGSGAQGTLNISGGALTQNTGYFTNGENGGEGNINISGGVVNWDSISGNFRNGAETGGRGVITLSGGTWNHYRERFFNGFGTGGIGTINISGGTFNYISGSDFYNAYASAAGGNINVTSGCFNWNSSEAFYNGGSSDGPGVFTISGGTFNTGNDGWWSYTDGWSEVTLFGGRCDGNFNVISGNFSMPPDSALIIGAGKTLTVPAQVPVALNGALYGSGTINLMGLTYTSSVITVTANNTFNVRVPFTLGPTYTLKNLSSNSINIYDTLTVGGLLENGGVTAGTINIYKPGTLLIPGGTVINKHANSAINVDRGGSILNFYGTLDSLLGTCTVAAGGLISNESGNFNYNSSAITFSTGSVFFERDHVELCQDFDLDFTWTITVPAIIHGNGRYINFLVGGAFQINPGASLLLDGVMLNGVSGSAIRCVDNTGTLSLCNVVWMQDADYSFTLGAIDIIGDVVVQGPGLQFGYSSTMTSTIHHNASLLFDNQTTFSYLAPSPTLLVIEDKSSVFAFDNAKYYAEQNVRLTHGNVIFDNCVTLSVATGKTLYFGNKTNYPSDATYDVDIDLLAAANIGVSGNVVVDNVNA